MNVVLPAMLIDAIQWDKRQRGYRAMGYRVEAPREFGEISESCSVTTACP